MHPERAGPVPSAGTHRFAPGGEITARFAPSPTSELHLGNLRTALGAWLLARSTGRQFRLRVEDLDTQRVTAAGDVAQRQLADLAALGIDFDGEVVWQSARLPSYLEALARLDTYPCFCTRREIAEAASAPHSDGYRPYPGTCRELQPAKLAELAATRAPALRVRSGQAVSTINDLWAGEVSAVVDDFVVVRNDGVPAYNLAVVVDDIEMSIDQICRGDDLLSSAPRQAWLTEQLGGVRAEYAHLPLVVNQAGQRLAKRDRSVTLAELEADGMTTTQVRAKLAESLGIPAAVAGLSPTELVEHFNPADVPRQAWIF